MTFHNIVRLAKRKYQQGGNQRIVLGLTLGRTRRTCSRTNVGGLRTHDACESGYESLWSHERHYTASSGTQTRIFASLSSRLEEIHLQFHLTNVPLLQCSGSLEDQPSHTVTFHASVSEHCLQHGVCSRFLMLVYAEQIETLIQNPLAGINATSICL